MAAVRRVHDLALGMRLGCKRLGADAALPWHDHGVATLCVVLSGAMEEEDAGEVRLREAGDVVFRPEPTRHRNRVLQSPVSFLNLEVDASAMAILHRLGLPARGPMRASSRRALRLAKMARVELQDPGAASELELLGIAYELFATLVRHESEASPQRPAWVLRVHDRLRDEPRTAPDLAELAAEASVSPFQLSRVFRRHYGASIGEFLRQARVEKAMTLLVETDLPLVEVALEAGFYDQSHLTNVLKQHTGFTPASLRRRGSSIRRGFPDDDPANLIR